MSYLDFNGSLVLPTSSVIPYASSLYATDSPPSGYLYCDGNFYDSQDPKYIPLFNVIGTFYGEVDYFVSPSVTKKYFRVPNLMGQDYPYTNNEDVVTPTPNAGVSSTTIGGLNNSGAVNTASDQILISDPDYMPSHYHVRAIDYPSLKPTDGNTYIDTGHSHTVSPGLILVSTGDTGAHTHGVTDPDHRHSTGTGTGQIAIYDSIWTTGSYIFYTSGMIFSGSNQTGTTNLSYINGGEYTDASTTGITVTDSNTPNITSTVKIDPAYATNDGNAYFSGTVNVSDGTSGLTGSGSVIELPITPSFVMSYLIKL